MGGVRGCVMCVSSTSALRSVPTMNTIKLGVVTSVMEIYMTSMKFGLMITEISSVPKIVLKIIMELRR